MINLSFIRSSHKFSRFCKKKTKKLRYQTRERLLHSSRTFNKAKNFLHLIKEFNKFVKKNPEENLNIWRGELKNRSIREIKT